MHSFPLFSKDEVVVQKLVKKKVVKVNKCNIFLFCRKVDKDKDKALSLETEREREYDLSVKMASGALCWSWVVKNGSGIIPILLRNI